MRTSRGNWMTRCWLIIEWRVVGAALRAAKSSKAHKAKLDAHVAEAHPGAIIDSDVLHEAILAAELGLPGPAVEESCPGAAEDLANQILFAC